jgi:hypothetical protein
MTCYRITATYAAAFAAAALLLTGCGGKALEPFKDAKVNGRNDAPATIGTAPDGFGNWARKCDGPNMVYTLFHSDSPYGGIQVVPNDPRCGPSTQ